MIVILIAIWAFCVAGLAASVVGILSNGRTYSARMRWLPRVGDPDFYGKIDALHRVSYDSQMLRFWRNPYADLQREYERTKT